MLHMRCSMGTTISNFLLSCLPVVLWGGRIILFLLAIIILFRCCRSLFGKKVEQEVWGFLSLSNGARYDLCHWENTIGRARNTDVRVNFPSVSRSHAAICRDDSGEWRIYPLNRKSGILLNGDRTFESQTIKAGDVIAVGGVELFFFPADDFAEAKQAEKRTKPGKTISPAGTLWVLTLFQIFTFAQFIPMLDAETFLPITIAFSSICAIMWILYAVYRIFKRTAYEAESLVFFLITIGVSIAAAYSPSSLYKLLVTMVLGIVLYLILSILLRSQKRALKWRWYITAAAGALLAFNVVFGQRIFGAKNWVSIGPLSFQPSELVKIAFVLAGAATLDRLFAKRNLIFTLLFSAYCVGCLALMSDFGTALIFFVAFLCIAFLRTGDLPSIAMMVAAAGFGGGIILHFKPYIADRFTVWRHAWEYTQTTGYQQSRAMSAIASSGLFGAGPKNAWLKYVGAANTDLVFGVVSEEFGFLLALCAIAALIILAIFTLRCAATARSSFYTIASCAATAMLVFQATLNVLGAVDLLPLTGVTFPFVSMGGSSMISCWGLFAFLKAADTRQNASFILKLPKRKINVPTYNASEEPQETDHFTGTFFDEIPDIPLDDIFGKDDKQ